MKFQTHIGNEFDRNEVESIYVGRDERFVVSLIVGYAEERDGVETPAHAAAAALALTRDDGSSGTHWFVYDRQTGVLHVLEQSDFESIEVV
jgi:hypothetical protein